MRDSLACGSNLRLFAWPVAELERPLLGRDPGSK